MENYLRIRFSSILLGCGNLFVGDGAAEVTEIVPIGIVLEQILLRNEYAQHFKILIHFRQPGSEVMVDIRRPAFMLRIHIGQFRFDGVAEILDGHGAALAVDDIDHNGHHTEQAE